MCPISKPACFTRISGPGNEATSAVHLKNPKILW